MSKKLFGALVILRGSEGPEAKTSETPGLESPAYLRVKDGRFVICYLLEPNSSPLELTLKGWMVHRKALACTCPEPAPPRIASPALLRGSQARRPRGSAVEAEGSLSQGPSLCPPQDLSLFSSSSFRPLNSSRTPGSLLHPPLSPGPTEWLADMRPRYPSAPSPVIGRGK